MLFRYMYVDIVIACELERERYGKSFPRYLVRRGYIEYIYLGMYIAK